MKPSHRRSALLGELHRAGIIRYSRGELLSLDRDRLEHAACACYSVGRRPRPPY